MWQLLKAVKRQLGLPRRRKSSRVADESLAGPLQAPPGDQQGGGGVRDGPTVGSLSVLLVIVRAPLAVASCLVGKAGGGAEEVWGTSTGRERRPRTAEMDQLMVRDSMRYAIYV
ncbi:uncharacterized protein M6B38_187245 [Iris pallida]|uniref:Uncharacterized protein n=1 Tax=Iris pallida TaxID=29817 RepID=A0AAX6EJT6_IRIPA|nr:uncharacterized protein M6B38_187245 [Iris pallida]